MFPCKKACPHHMCMVQGAAHHKFMVFRAVSIGCYDLLLRQKHMPYKTSMKMWCGSVVLVISDFYNMVLIH